MSTPWMMRNSGAAILGRMADSVYVLAGGGADGVEQDGEIFDLDALGNPLSCKVIMGYRCAVADTETLTWVMDVDDSADSGMSGATQYDAGIASAVVFTGAGATVTDEGEFERDIDLSGVLQYLRVQHTVTLSAANTDTATVAIIVVFGGFAEQAQTETTS